MNIIYNNKNNSSKKRFDKRKFVQKQKYSQKYTKIINQLSVIPLQNIDFPEKEYVILRHLTSSLH